MDDLFYEIFSNLPRQGPGDKNSTLKAASLVEGINSKSEILDVGCGTGKQTLELANYFEGKITAVDNHQPYLEVLSNRALENGFVNIISCKNADILKSSFLYDKYNLIWAEGSIYIMGFKDGLHSFKSLLKHSGYIAVTEVSWFKTSPPKELKDFWDSEYPEINTIENNLKIIETLGYKNIDHFKLPDSAWSDDYYIPLENRLKKLRIKNDNDNKALELIEMVQHEIDIFHKYSSYYGYVFYIAQKID